VNEQGGGNIGFRFQLTPTNALIEQGFEPTSEH
jgi:hypothetical protein